MQEHQIFTAPQTVTKWLQQPSSDEEPEVEYLSPRWPTREQRGLTSKASGDAASTAGISLSPSHEDLAAKGQS